ncbi:MAG: stage II sporulation protein M [Methanotrichaceae archaeon]
MSFKDDIAYLRSIRVYIGLSVLIFAVTIVMGYYAAQLNSDLATSMLKEFEMLKWITQLPLPLLMVVIFLKNLLSCIMSVLLGLGMGIVPLIVDTSNGFLLGVVLYNVLQKEGLLYFLAGVVPHGIIELPTVLMSIGIGFRLGYLLALTVFGEKANLAQEIRIAIHFLVRWVAPLLLLAAAIETFITPIVISVVK